MTIIPDVHRWKKIHVVVGPDKFDRPIVLAGVLLCVFGSFAAVLAGRAER